MPDRTEILAATGALEAALRGLLTALDDETADADALGRAWRRCRAGEDRLRELQPALDELLVRRDPDLESRLRTLTRLNAVAADLTRREGARVQGVLRSIAAARRVVRAQSRRTAEAGDSVDVSG